MVFVIQHIRTLWVCHTLKTHAYALSLRRVKTLYNTDPLEGSIVCWSFPLSSWLQLLMFLGVLQQGVVQNPVVEEVCCISSLCITLLMYLCFVVGGVTSPWRGEYREPRCLSLNQENNPQTSLSSTINPVSETASGPDLAVSAPCVSRSLQPPSLELSEETARTSWNLCKEFLGVSDPTSVLTKSSSYAERAMTVSEQELQQLEIGKTCTVQYLLRKMPFFKLSAV